MYTCVPGLGKYNFVMGLGWGLNCTYCIFPWRVSSLFGENFVLDKFNSMINGFCSLFLNQFSCLSVQFDKVLTISSIVGRLFALPSHADVIKSA